MPANAIDAARFTRPQRFFVLAFRQEFMRPITMTLVMLLLVACGNSASDPEDALREWVARGEAAAEAKDRGDLLELISDDYLDSRSNNREQIGDILRLYFLRQQSIELLTSIDEIVFFDDTAARIALTVGMAGTNAGAWGFRADAYRFDLELHRVDSEWLLIGARWGELGGEMH